jgi:hypothetical protein
MDRPSTTGVGISEYQCPLGQERTVTFDLTRVPRGSNASSYMGKSTRRYSVSVGSGAVVDSVGNEWGLQLDPCASV